jgi:predicted nucleic acid-binding Zn ribbon protein
MNQCTLCGGEVPDFAQVCMHCGAVFTNTQEYKSDQLVQGLVGGLVIVVIAAVFIYSYLNT